MSRQSGKSTLDISHREEYLFKKNPEEQKIKLGQTMDLPSLEIRISFHMEDLIKLKGFNFFCFVNGKNMYAYII